MLRWRRRWTFLPSQPKSSIDSVHSTGNRHIRKSPQTNGRKAKNSSWSEIVCLLQINSIVYKQTHAQRSNWANAATFNSAHGRGWKKNDETWQDKLSRSCCIGSQSLNILACMYSACALHKSKREGKHNLKLILSWSFIKKCSAIQLQVVLLSPSLSLHFFSCLPHSLSVSSETLTRVSSYATAATTATVTNAKSKMKRRGWRRNEKRVITAIVYRSSRV